MGVSRSALPLHASKRAIVPVLDVLSSAPSGASQCRHHRSNWFGSPSSPDTSSFSSARQCWRPTSSHRGHGCSAPSGGTEAANTEGNGALAAGLAAVHAQRAPGAPAHGSRNVGVPAGERGGAPAGVLPVVRPPDVILRARLTSRGRARCTSIGGRTTCSARDTIPRSAGRATRSST